VITDIKLAPRNARGMVEYNMDFWLQERYPTHADYVAKVTAAAASLVGRHLLLPEDAAFLIDQANAAAVP